MSTSQARDTTEKVFMSIYSRVKIDFFIPVPLPPLPILKRWSSRRKGRRSCAVILFRLGTIHHPNSFHCPRSITSTCLHCPNYLGISDSISLSQEWLSQFFYINITLHYIKHKGTFNQWRLLNIIGLCSLYVRESRRMGLRILLTCLVMTCLVLSCL